MKNTDKEYERLIESLTINQEVVPGMAPPFGGYSSKAGSWYNYQWQVPDVTDIAYKNAEGKYHRLFGPAYISTRYDYELWYKNGEFHRVDGPAVRHRANQIWYFEGKLHRIGGPAVNNLGGPKEYWINGQQLSPKEYKKEMERRCRRGLK